MPVVPRYSGPQVATAPLPGARLTPDAPAAAFGGIPTTPDLSGVQRELGRIFEEEQQKANQVAVLDADNKLSELGIKLQTDALSRHGKDALGATDAASQAWQQGVSEIGKGLTTDDQRLAFQARVDSRWASLHESIERHTAAESQAYDDQTTQAALATRLRDAVTNYTDPAMVARSVAETRAIIADKARRDGASPEMRQAQTDEAVSRIHVGVVDRMLANGQDLLASRYYAAAKDQITGPDATAVERALEEGSSRGESQRQADAITAKSSTMTAALEQVRTIDDPKVRDLTEQRVRQYYAAQRQAEEEDRQARFQTASNIVERTHDAHAVPPSMWITFTIPEREELERRAAQLASGIPVATNWTTYYDLKTLASSDATRDRFLKTNLLGYRSQLADTEFKELVSLQAGLRKGESGADAQLGSYRTVGQVVNDALNAAGIDPTPKPGSDAAEQVALFRRSVDQQVGELEQRTGKKASGDDAQRIVDNLLVQGVVAGSGIFGFFPTKRRAFQRQPGETLVLQVQDIPPLERTQIEDALRRKDMPITDQNILRLYQRRIQSMAPGAAGENNLTHGGGASF